MNIEIKIIYMLHELLAIKDEIYHLLDQYKPQQYFFEIDWLKHWTDFFCLDCKLFILLAYEGSELVGFLPLFIHTQRLHGLNLKLVEIIGTKQSAWGNILATRQKLNVFEAFAKILIENNNQWDLVSLQRIRSQEDKDIFCKILRDRNILCTDNYMGSIYGLNGYESFEQYIKSRKASLIKNYKRYKRNLEKTGKFEFITSEQLTKEEVREYMATIARNSWQGVNNQSILSPNNITKNLSSFHKALLTSDHYRLNTLCFFIKLDNIPISYRYGLVLNKKFTSYSIEYDINYKKYGPGIVLHYMTVEYLINHDIKDVDFGIGDGQHKDEWTDWDDDLYTIYMYKYSFKSLTYYLLRKVWYLKKKFIALKSSLKNN